jgi:hypothetical protein
VLVTAKAEQANKHDDKQDYVGSKRDDCCHFGNLDVEHYAEAAESFICIAKLSEGLARKV